MGIDMNAALNIVGARSFEAGVVSELLGAAEIGLLEGLKSQEED
jgi:hypothetical protein